MRRLLRTLEKAGRFDQAALQPEQAIDRAEHRQVAREAAREAIVLLKNDPALLPLDAGKIKSIAVIGMNARWARSSAAAAPR